MKIQKVNIKKFKVLEDFSADIHGANILLIGDNGVGKSSVMQFIGIALGDGSNIPPNAEGEGEVITDKAGKKYTFQVKFKGGKPVVSVTSPDGLKDVRKSAIAALVGAIDFNVDEFVSLSDSAAGRKKQVEIYKGFLKSDVIDEISRMERNIQIDFDERTEINRKSNTLSGFIKESPLFGKELNIMPVDVSEIQKKLNEAIEFNNKIKGVEDRGNERMRESARLAEEITELEKKIANAMATIGENETKNEEAKVWLKANPPIDTAALSEQMNNASEINSQASLAEDQKKKIAELTELTTASGELTAKIESNRQAIQDAIRDMDVPVEGLRFDSEQLIYNDIAVSTASLSTSEIIHLGCKLKMAQNPEFGVLFIEHGESIGSQRMKDILEMANKYGWQVIMEQVQRGTDELKIEFMQPVEALA